VALTYTFDSFREGFVSILAAEQTPDTMDWYQGTADAVRKNLRHIRPTGAEDVLILSGDHIYRMDYRMMVALHRQQRADVTIAALPVGAEEIHRFGILRTTSEGRVEEFSEKPATTDQVKGWELGPVTGGNLPHARGPVFLASMGIYAIRFGALQQILAENSGADFGHDVIPRSISKQRVYAYPFVGYWEDIGTMRSYYEANLALTNTHPAYDLYDQQMRLFTRARFLPGAHLGKANVAGSLICAGARSRLLTAERSIIGTRAVLQDNVTVRDSYIVGADFYETPEELAENRELKRPDIGIGGDTMIRCAIVDKNARIGYGVTIDPPANCSDMEGEGYAVRDGIVVIEKGATIGDGSRIPEVKPRADR